MTRIYNYAFDGCISLSSITIPNSVTGLAAYAFQNCIGLTSINLSNSLSSIPAYSFQGCTGLISINIPNSVQSISNFAFNGCSSLNNVTIGNGINFINKNAFSSCKELTDVYCYANNVPTTSSDAFQDSYIEYATLHVPAASVNAYREAEPWKNFKQIVAIDGETPPIPETKKCAKPTISYDNFKLTYNCETEGVEYVYEIKDTDVKKGYDKEVSLSATYEISVYATKTGYDNSDVATATLVFTNATFTTEGTSSAKSANVNPVLIQANNGIITVEGADDGERIHVYTPAGSQEGSAISQNRLATINTHIKPGDIAIIKIGSRAVKVVMK